MKNRCEHCKNISDYPRYVCPNCNRLICWECLKEVAQIEHDSTASPWIRSQ